MMILAGCLVLAMTLTMFLTQRQLIKKGMPKSALEGPMAQQQKIMIWVLPLVFGISGVFFPIGVLLYWTTSNLWTMGQQFYVIRNNPAPNTEAFRAKELRDAEKRKRKGEPPDRQAGQPARHQRAGRATQAPAAPAAEEADPLPAQEDQPQAGQNNQAGEQEEPIRDPPGQTQETQPGFRPDDSPSSKGESK